MEGSNVALIDAGSAQDTRSIEDPRVQPLLNQLMGDGFLLIEDAIAPETAVRIQRQMQPWFERTPKCVGDFYGWQTTRVGGLLSKAPLTQSLVMHDLVLGLARAALKPSCDCIQLNLTQAIRVHPSEDAQAPHRDEEMWPHEPKLRPWLINVMWPLTDFTEANGATRLWPRSHRAGLDRALDPGLSIAGAMKPGAALIFLGSLTHGAGANRSKAPRDGIIVSYCLGWLKQYENAFLAYPREVARQFSPDLQRLIGYQIHRPNLGGCEGRDPIERLGDGRGRAAPHVDALTPGIAEELRALKRANADGS